jgi:3-oxoacyl-[acyl-carrier protein] reductase
MALRISPPAMPEVGSLKPEVRMDTTNAAKVALVTGGSRGIGYAIAEALTATGAAVVITGRDSSHLDSAVAKLDPAKSHAVRADVRDPAQAARAVETAVERFGGLDILINNAGVGLFANVADMTVDAWQQVLETNISVVFHCCRAAVPRMRQRGGGWIINISSLAGANAFAGGAAYCASKAAVNAFSESLMQEVRYDNIRVSSVAPGSVSTGFGDRGEHGTADWKLAPEDVARVVIDLLAYPARSLPSRVELRPSRPARTKS